MTRLARWRISALFVVFEAGMPLIGLAIGAPLAQVIGPTADYVAAAAVVAIGAWMLLSGDSDDEEKAGRLVSARGAALLGLGISISLDELAIGFSVGLTHLPLIPVCHHRWRVLRRRIVLVCALVGTRLMKCDSAR